MHLSHSQPHANDLIPYLLMIQTDRIGSKRVHPWAPVVYVDTKSHSPIDGQDFMDSSHRGLLTNLVHESDMENPLASPPSQRALRQPGDHVGFLGSKTRSLQKKKGPLR